MQEAEEETVSFTAEARPSVSVGPQSPPPFFRSPRQRQVAAGRSLEAAAKLQAPPEVAEAALAAAAAEARR